MWKELADKREQALARRSTKARSRMTTNMLMTTPRKTMIQQVMPGRHLLTSQKTTVRGQKSLCQEDLRVETKANRPSIKTLSVKKSLRNISKGTDT